MYIWKIDKLNEELIAGDITQREIFKYLMASSILYALAMIKYSNANTLDTLLGVACMVITVIGLLFIYKCNGGDNGKDFLIRYILISWVVGVRMFVLLTMPVIIVSIILKTIYMGGVSGETTNIELIYIILLNIISVLWVAKHINRVAKASNT